MLPRILSIAAPSFVYATLIVLAYGLYRERKRFEWLMLAPAGAAFLAALLFIPSTHRLYPDEDIYIQIASNLAKAPVAQIAVLGGPDRIDVSTYYKEPSGFPVLLSFVFLLFGGGSEAAASVLARLMYAGSVAAIYVLAMAVVNDRRKAIFATIAFAAIPMAFWFSASSGTDAAASLFSTLGVMGIVLASGPLAVGGLAMAAQTRLEMIALMPLLLFAARIDKRWKVAGLALVSAEILHIVWVMTSLEPILAKAEHVESGFSIRYVLANAGADLQYVLRPWLFPTILLVLAAIAFFKWKDRNRLVLGLWIASLSAVYLVFYAGSFDVNPRYSIQIVGPLCVLASTAVSRKPVYALGILLVAVPWLFPMSDPQLVQTLRSDHDIAVEFAGKLDDDDLVLTPEPEVFLNHGIHAMNAIFTAERGTPFLQEQLGRYKRVWYFAGVRTGLRDTLQWNADQWVRANLELERVDFQEIRGLRISWYRLLKLVDRKAG